MQAAIRKNAMPTAEPNAVATAIAPPYLTPREASAYLKVPVSTLAVWRSTDRVLLPYRKVGGHVRYVQSELDQFAKEGGAAIKPRRKSA